MKVLYKKEYTLSPMAVDAISENLGEVLEGILTDRRERMRLRLSLEEILLNWMDTLEGKTIRFYVEQRKKKLSISAEIPGEPKDPLKGGEEYGNASMAEGILSNLGLVWLYRYSEGVNQVSIQVNGKKAGQFTRVATALAAAAACGAALKRMPAVSAPLMEYLVDPLFNTFMGFLSAFVAPMMFLSVVWGIYSIGNPKQLGRIGKKVCLRFFFHNTLAALLGAGATILLFSVDLGGQAGAGGQLKTLLDMVYDIVPGNLLEPFLSGNTMQIIFLAVVVGITMILIQNQVPVAAHFVEQCNAIVQQILSAVSRMVPGFIFLSVLRLIVGGNFSGIGGFLKMAAAFVALSAVLIAMHLFLIWRQTAVSPLLVLKKVLPVYFIALTTGSSAAAFSSCVDCCVKKLGIDEKLVNFGLPLGIVVYMPNYAAWLVLFAGACAQYGGRSLVPVDLLLAVCMAVFLAVAAPPIPGGALACYTILLMQFDFPMELLAIASALNVILDFVGTAGHVFANQMALLQSAASMGMLDRVILEREDPKQAGKRIGREKRIG